MKKEDVEKIRGTFTFEGSGFRFTWRHCLSDPGIEVRIGKRWMSDGDIQELLEAIETKENEIIQNWQCDSLGNLEQASSEEMDTKLKMYYEYFGRGHWLEDYEEEEDEWGKIRNEGDLIAEQEWDSGGPGAGAGVVSVYEFEGKYYVDHDAGIDEYETKEEALLQIPENEATVSTTIYDD